MQIGEHDTFEAKQAKCDRLPAALHRARRNSGKPDVR